MTSRTVELPGDLLAKLARVSLSPEGMIRGRMQGKRRSRQLGASLDFADYRQYAPGDDIRQLDWNVYARTGKPFIKLFLDEQELQVQLFIDTTASMGFGANEAFPDKLLFAKQLAACIAYAALCGYDRVGVNAFGAAHSQALPLLRGRGSFTRLSSFLSALQPSDGQPTVRTLLTPRLLPRHPGMSWVFSDFLYEEGVEPVLNALCERGQQVVAVHILSPEEMDPQLTGDLNLVDSETGTSKEVAVSNPVLKAYRKERDRFLYSVQKACYERGIAYVLAPTNRSLEETVLGTFRKRLLLQ